MNEILIYMCILNTNKSRNMPKTNNIDNKKRRPKGKDKKKNTFKKYGKNTTRGLRIKQEQLEKRAEQRKAEGDNFLVKFQIDHSKSKGKGQGRNAKSTCKITCSNKKHGSK